jgi:magnesium transporter
MTIVDSAVFYVDGKRAEEPRTLAETHEAARERGGVVWIGLSRPAEKEFQAVAEEFGLHELAVEDAVVAHQRPKIERYGDTLFVVLKAARYLDAPEEVDFGEVHVFVGEDFVVTVRHGGAPDLASVRRRMEREPVLLGRGPEAILYAVMDRVVDDYYPVVRGLENDVYEIEAEVFGGNPDVSQRIDEELRRYLRDVQDHAIEVAERVEGFRQLLQNILSVNLALVSLQQNEEVKRLSEVGIQQNDEVKKRLPPATKRAKTSGGLDYDGRYRASDRDSRC